MPLQQITLIKKHKYCGFARDVRDFLFSGYFHVNSLRKKFYSIDPPKWPPGPVVANQELFKSINRLLLNVIDYGTRSFFSYFEKIAYMSVV